MFCKVMELICRLPICRVQASTAPSRHSPCGLSHHMPTVPVSVDSHNIYNKPWPISVAPIAGKGFGVIADRNVDVGERVLAEAPLIKLSPADYQYGLIAAKEGGSCGGASVDSLKAAVGALSAEQRALFFDLSQNEDRWGATRTIEGIWATNSLPCHAFSQGHNAILPLASRFNHSCAPNSSFSWNSHLGCLTIHAARPVVAGEELCISYGFPANCVLRSQRRERLRRSFGFDCSCTACSLNGAARAESDQRRAAIGDKISTLAELEEWSGSVRELMDALPQRLLSRMSERYALLRAECPDGLHAGLDSYLQAFCEACEAVRARRGGRMLRGLGRPAG